MTQASHQTTIGVKPLMLSMLSHKYRVILQCKPISEELMKSSSFKPSTCFVVSVVKDVSQCRLPGGYVLPHQLNRNFEASFVCIRY